MPTHRSENKATLMDLVLDLVDEVVDLEAWSAVLVPVAWVVVDGPFASRCLVYWAGRKALRPGPEEMRPTSRPVQEAVHKGCSGFVRPRDREEDSS